MAEPVRIAAIADIHCGRTSQRCFDELFTEISAKADILLLCGDVTDYGLPDEAHILVSELARSVRMPRLAVLGNHDYESGRQEELKAIFTESGIKMMDGDAFEFRGVGFVGVKGFGGGFGTKMLEPWGEPIIKQFVQEAVQESLKLEAGLARIDTPHKVVMLHYAPILQTVQGEPCETFAFLGSSRFEEPINRYSVDFVVHGHAHHGFAEGKTREGIPVYNVASPVLRANFPGQQPVRYFSVTP